MIILVAGKPGSGKSYFMSLKIKEWINTGYIVLTNMVVYPLTIRIFGKELINEHKKFKERFYFFNDDVTIEELWKFPKKIIKGNIKEGMIKLVIDEGLMLINKKYNENKKEFIKFLTQHRKLGYDIYLLAQSKNEIDTTIRSLIDILWYIRYVREVFLLDIPYLRVFYERNLNNNDIFMFKFFILNPLFFRFYESYKLHLKMKEDKEIENKEIKNIYNWVDIAGLLSPA